MYILTQIIIYAKSLHIDIECNNSNKSQHFLKQYMN
jgi:hypothetical protein